MGNKLIYSEMYQNIKKEFPELCPIKSTSGNNVIMLVAETEKELLTFSHSENSIRCQEYTGDTVFDKPKYQDIVCDIKNAKKRIKHFLATIKAENRPIVPPSW